MSPTGPLGFALLSFLPGAWLTFGLRLPGVGVVARVLLAVIMSPVVVAAQFYALRLFGVPFAATVVVLVVINLPALYLVFRGWSETGRPTSVAGIGPYLLVWVIPIFLLLTYFHQPAANALRAHSFVHADIVYGLANGGLRPEEYQLAGVPLGYPWGGHVHQAVLSRLWGIAPAGSYPWTNLVLLLATGTLVALVCRRIGGGVRASVLAILWVLFAVNAVGYALLEFIAPEELAARYPIWGDASLHPWMRKYSLWNQHPYGHGFFAATLFLLSGPRDETFSASTLFLAAVALVGLAVMYPPLIPAAGILLIARFLHDVIRGRRAGLATAIFTNALPLAAVGVVAVIATALTLAIVGEPRAAGTGVALSSAWHLKIKTLTILVTFAPLLAGTGLLVLRGEAWRDRRPVLLFGGCGGLALFLVFSIQNGVLDYKPMFGAAICLAPLASLGVDRVLGHGGRGRAVAYGLVMVFLVGMGADRMLRKRFQGPVPLELRIDDFEQRLAEDHELHDPLRAIAESSPSDAVVVVDSLEMHVPTFAVRPVYAPPSTESILLGVGMRSREMLGRTRGYGLEIVRERQDVVRDLYRSPDHLQRRRALEEIRRLGRPLAILLEPDRHAELLGTLESAGAGELLYADERWAVWLDDPARRGARSESTSSGRSSMSG